MGHHANLLHTNLVEDREDANHESVGEAFVGFQIDGARAAGEHRAEPVGKQLDVDGIVAEKDDLIRMIAYHMKKSYLTWNREAVSDEEIIADLKTLAGGDLEISSDLKLPETKDILAKNRGKKKGGGKKKQQS